MTLAVPIIIYAVSVLAILIAVITAAVNAGITAKRPFFKTPGWGQIILGVITTICGLVAWIGFPSGTITLIIWAVLTLA